MGAIRNLGECWKDVANTVSERLDDIANWQEAHNRGVMLMGDRLTALERQGKAQAERGCEDCDNATPNGGCKSEPKHIVHMSKCDNFKPKQAQEQLWICPAAKTCGDRVRMTRGCVHGNNPHKKTEGCEGNIGSVNCPKCIPYAEAELVEQKRVAFDNGELAIRRKCELDKMTEQRDECKAVAYRWEKENAELKRQYNELIMAVARKFPNESRHHTALRYIVEAENREATVAAPKDKSEVKR